MNTGSLRINNKIGCSNGDKYYVFEKLPVISEHPKIEQRGGSTGKKLFAVHESNNFQKT